MPENLQRSSPFPKIKYANQCLIHRSLNSQAFTSLETWSSPDESFLKLASNSLGQLLHARRGRLLQHARGHLLDHLHGRLGDVDVLAVDVVPRAPDEEGDVVGEVEDRGDEGQAEKEEEDGVWREREREG